MSGPGGVFNIGSQQAGAIYQAARDQTILRAGGTLTTGPMAAVADLRSALQTAVLPQQARREAEQALDEVEAELGHEQSDKRRIGNRVERLIDVLSQAGSLVSAGESLLPPLRTLATWLGAAGLGALRLLA